MYGVLSSPWYDNTRLTTYIRPEHPGVRRLRGLRMVSGEHREPAIGMWMWKNGEEVEGWVE